MQNDRFKCSESSEYHGTLNTCCSVYSFISSLIMIPMHQRVFRFFTSIILSDWWNKSRDDMMNPGQSDMTTQGEGPCTTTYHKKRKCIEKGTCELIDRRKQRSRDQTCLEKNSFILTR